MDAIEAFSFNTNMKLFTTAAIATFGASISRKEASRSAEPPLCVLRDLNVARFDGKSMEIRVSDFLEPGEGKQMCLLEEEYFNISKILPDLGCFEEIYVSSDKKSISFSP
jgi:hypothetical protein